MLLWAIDTGETEAYISNFNDLFASNNVSIIYPSEQTPKPHGCNAAMVSDWTASAFIYTKLKTVKEGVDIESDFVNQTSGKSTAAPGSALICFGGSIVNAVVAYAENEETPVKDRAPIKFHQNAEACYFKLKNGTDIAGAYLLLSSLNNNLDMFVIEVYQDGDGRYVMLFYGFGWKGTYVAGKYFETEIYPNVTAYPHRWIIVLWSDANRNGFVNTAADGDIYTIIATDQLAAQSDNDNWLYRKSHIINSAVGAGTNYQVKIVAHYGAGIDTGEDVYLNSKCKSDFGDIRFTAADGSILLDYWMESVTYYDNAVFWVKIPGDLGKSDQTIYVYYGNTAATSTSNGTNTFLFFDDFDESLDKWTARHGIWSIDSSDFLKTPILDNYQIATASFMMQDGRIRYHFKQDSPITGVNLASLGCFAMSPREDTFYLFQCVDQAVRDTLELWKFVDGYSVDGYKTGLAGTVVNVGANWHTGEFLLYGSELRGRLDDLHEVKVIDTTLATTGYLGFRYGGMEGKYFLIDWVAVGKYVSPEPSHGSWGQEETATLP
ncbi:MAG: DUF2341 domain-containing protein [Candidatus Bathyarchaeia archaeon]